MKGKANRKTRISRQPPWEPPHRRLVRVLRVEFQLTLICVKEGDANTSHGGTGTLLCFMPERPPMKSVTAGAGLIVLSTFVAASWNVALADSTPPPATGSAPAFSVLVGQWARTQGPYVITINAVDDNGKLEAAYANPRPLPF